MKYDLNNKTNRFAERTPAAFSETLFKLLEDKAFEKKFFQKIKQSINYLLESLEKRRHYDILFFCNR